MITTMFSQNGSIISHTGSIINETAVSNAAIRVRPRLLFLEVQRLRMENEQLRAENIELRNEVTRLRLYNQMEAAGLEFDIPGAFPQTLSDSLKKFFYLLPNVFMQHEFFELAQDVGYGADYAQHILTQYISERLLVRKGNELLEKADLCQYELPLI